MPNPTKLVHNCDTGITEEIELTDEEVAELAAQAEQAAIEQAARDAEAQRIADLKASAKAKLVAGQPLTEEEAAQLIL